MHIKDELRLYREVKNPRISTGKSLDQQHALHSRKQSEYVGFVKIPDCVRNDALGGPTLCWPQIQGKVIGAAYCRILTDGTRWFPVTAGSDTD